MEAEIFWEWFVENNQKYYSLNQLTPELNDLFMDQFQSKLHEYSEGLYFKIGGFGNPKRELIVTAESNIDYFDKVEELVKTAPLLNNWNIIAFKQPIEGDFIVEYEGLEIDSTELWFLPMQHKNNKNLFGLTVGIPGFIEEDKDRYLGAVYQLLDLLVGEKSVSLHIHYLEIDECPEIPEDDGYLKISELKRYMDWHKDGIVPYSFSLN